MLTTPSRSRYGAVAEKAASNAKEFCIRRVAFCRIPCCRVRRHSSAGPVPCGNHS